MKYQAPPRALALFLLLPLVAPEMSDDGPIVRVAQGDVLGRIEIQPNATLTKYYAFEGIPYARPPLGQKRFKEPEEAEAWSGIRNATAPGAVCIQKDILGSFKVIGEEDCLFVNVYTADPPESWTETKRPVVVWVHGGAFIIGSGNMERTRPDTLLRNGLVVVSFNYRLSVMGFLSTGDAEVPGNAGLKDAVLALRWVQKNIAAFGGDPGKVTILGESAGSALVHYLVLSPLTEGLLHGAISMSGDALSPWASIKAPKKHAAALRDLLNSSCPDAAPEAIVPCLRSIDAKILVENHDKAPPPELAFRSWKNPFLPIVETPGSTTTPFLPAKPEQLMKEGRFQRVPYIMGFTSAEGILYLGFSKLLKNPSRWEEMDKQLEDAFKDEMPQGLNTRQFMGEVRKFYFGDRSVRGGATEPETLQKFVQMVGDIMFANSAVRSARQMAQSGGAVYMYEFTYDGPVAFFKNHLYNASGVPGVAHGEDMFYVFDLALPQGAGSSPAEVAVRERRVKLFADFARTGNPTPTGKETPIWPLYTTDEEKYMDMGTEFTVRDHILGERAVFWRRLASKSQDEISDTLGDSP